MYYLLNFEKFLGIKFIKVLIFVFLSLFFIFNIFSFASSQKTVTFSIYPLFYAFKDLVGEEIYSQYNYNVLINSTFDHHNFDLKPYVVKQTKNSKFIFFIGTLEIEKEFLKIIPSNKVVLFYKFFGNSHNDPHIWVSLKNYSKIVNHMYKYIYNSDLKIDKNKLYYNYKIIQQNINHLDKLLEKQFKYFRDNNIGVYSYHNEFYYFSKDYGFPIKPLFKNEEDISFKYIDQLLSEMKKNKYNIIILPPYYDNKVKDYISKKIDNVKFVNINTNSSYVEYKNLLIK